MLNVTVLWVNVLLLKSLCFILLCELLQCNASTKSIDDLFYQYDDEKNSMIATQQQDDADVDVNFYDELDNWMILENSMNVIFFGPPLSFLRIDAESILHILTYTKKHLIPISKAILAWDIVTDGKTAAYLRGRELTAFDSLLNVVPEEDLYYINFGDRSVRKYFARTEIDLSPRKYGVLAASYKRYFGPHWYRNGSTITKLGYLICGFPASDMKLIQPEDFTDINSEIFSKLDKCTNTQISVLYNIATHREAYGRPYQWSSHEIKKIGFLLTHLPEYEISALQLEAISAISPEVMANMNQNKLEYFTLQQIYRMEPKTRRIYILRMSLKSSLTIEQLSSKRRRNK
ncbi:uncharacterized protein LOC126369255 [Pectinophora gossypiella]|uniref:uncharacterized protein LOC126369255 n=1 Tax=Pectinophora gossypiella TaxID=13191 RepID=UPI00214ED453|nr:uncharacterized protein LOC126369255 [Pectinophora gossypiella]